MLFCETGPPRSRLLQHVSAPRADGLQAPRCQAKKETPSGNMACLLTDIQRCMQYMPSANLPQPLGSRASTCCQQRSPKPAPDLKSLQVLTGRSKRPGLWSQVWHERLLGGLCLGPTPCPVQKNSDRLCLWFPLKLRCGVFRLSTLE